MSTGNLNSKSNSKLITTIINYYFFLCALWVGISTLILLSIPGDPKNAWLFGFSKTRFGLLIGLLIITIVLTGLGILFWRKKNWKQSLIRKLARLSVEFGYLYPVLILAFGITVLTPYFYMFLSYPLEDFYLRVFPLILFLTLFTIQTFFGLSLIVWSNRKGLEIDPSNQHTIQIDPWKVAVVFLSITVVFILANLSANLIQLSGYASELTRYTDKLDLDGEVNLPTFYSSFLLLASALLLGIIAWTKGRQTPHYWSWVSLSAIFVYLAVDEATKLHELLIVPLRDNLQLGGIWFYAWVIVAIPLLILLAILFLPFIIQLPRKTKVSFLLAALLYVGGALGLEMVSGAIVSQLGNRNIIFMVLTTIEETLEMTGVIVFIYGLLDYIGTQFNQQSYMIKRRNG